MSSKSLGKRKEEDAQPPKAQATRKRKQRLHNEQSELEDSIDDSNGHESVWLDGPLALTILPPLGSYLTGGDFIRDGLVLALLFYYLRALIKTPWELYLKARARRPPSMPVEIESDDNVEPENIRLLRASARSELRLAELVYLGLCLLTPLLGTLLLRYGAELLSVNSSISWFSTGLFVLATGVRPWRHLIGLLTSRTEALHDIVHTPPVRPSTSSVALEQRISSLEGTIEDLRVQKSATSGEQQVVIARLEETIEHLEGQLRNATRANEVVRLEGEERGAETQRSLQSLMNEVDQLHRRVSSAAANAAAANTAVSSLAAANGSSLVWQPPRGSGFDSWGAYGGTQSKSRRPSNSPHRHGNPSAGMFDGWYGYGAPGGPGPWNAPPPGASLRTRVVAFAVYLLLISVHIAQDLLHKTVHALNKAAIPSSPRSPRKIEVSAAPKGNKTH